MRGLFKTVAMVFVLAVAYAFLAEFEPNSWDSSLRVLGLPVVSIRQSEALGWLAIGQTAGGVLVMAQGGVGLVMLGQGGVGAIFGIGQLMLGLVVPLAQVGLGAFYFTGQAGFGLQARGQGVLLRKPKEYFEELHTELNEVLG